MRSRKANKGEDVKQIDFVGLPFDKEAVQRLRDERMK